jgi:hypothetical protein
MLAIFLLVIVVACIIFISVYFYNKKHPRNQKPCSCTWVEEKDEQELEESFKEKYAPGNLSPSVLSKSEPVQETFKPVPEQEPQEKVKIGINEEACGVCGVCHEAETDHVVKIEDLPKSKPPVVEPVVEIPSHEKHTYSVKSEPPVVESKPVVEKVKKPRKPRTPKVK